MFYINEIWTRHNSTKNGIMIFFTVTLRPFIKYHSPNCFPSRSITKNAETHPPPMCDVIIEQPQNEINFFASPKNNFF